MARYFPPRDSISLFQADSRIHHRSGSFPSIMLSVLNHELPGTLEVPVQLQANKDRDTEGENQEKGPRKPLYARERNRQQYRICLP